MAVSRDIRELVESVVRERLSGTVVESVHVEADTDSDGDPIFRVTVVFDGKKALDFDRASTVARHLRHKLLALDESTFPIFAFVSKADASRPSEAA